MRLDELLEGIEALDLREIYPDMQVAAITCDSRKVTPGGAFVAIPGTSADGHQYIPEALAAGATLVVHSKPLPPEMVGSFVRVQDARAVFALLSAKLAGQPSRELRVIGVTGTNGKTSAVLIAQHLLNSAGCRAAALGTLGLRKPGAAEFERRGLTTPDSATLQQMMRELVDDGATHLLLEVSSHALVQHRVTGVEFTGAVFTNLTQDHFDYHDTREAYVEAKVSLFTHHLVLSGGYAVINTDDETGKEIAQRFGGIGARFGASETNNLMLSNVENTLEQLSWELLLKNGVWPPRRDPSVNHARFASKLVGRYNAYNCVAAAGVALLEGLSLPQVVEGMATFDCVPGRLQAVPNQRGLHVFVDYAHTPDAVASVLGALQEVRPPGARIITVIGCGGDRDQAKRPLMGRVAQGSSDMTFITSDNPRGEDPDAIIDQMMTGIDEHGTEVARECDRRTAIGRALAAARPGDVVLIAGKGHEDYQILGSTTIHFSDVEEAALFLA